MTTSTLDVLNQAFSLNDFLFDAGDGNSCSIQLRDIDTVINNVEIVNGRQELDFDIRYSNVGVTCGTNEGQVDVDSVLTFSSLNFDEVIPFNTVSNIACEDLKVFQSGTEVSINDFGVDLITVCENIDIELNAFINTIENKELFQLAQNRLPQFNNAIEDLQNKINNANQNKFQFALENNGDIEATIETLIENLLAAPVLVPLIEAVNDNDIDEFLVQVEDLFGVIIDDVFPSNARVLQEPSEALTQLLELVNLNLQQLANILGLEQAAVILLLDTTFQVLLQVDPILVNFIGAFGADTTLSEFLLKIFNLDLNNLDFEELLGIFNPLGISSALFIELFDQFDDLLDIVFRGNFPILADFANEFIEQFEREFRETLGNLQVNRNQFLPDNLQLFLQAIAKAVKDLDFLAVIAPLRLREISDFLGLEQRFEFNDGSTLQLRITSLDFQGRFRDENIVREDLDNIFNIPVVILDPSRLILRFASQFRDADNNIVTSGVIRYEATIAILPDLAGALAFDFNTLNQVSFFQAVDEASLVKALEEVATCFFASTALQFGQKTIVTIDSDFIVDNRDLEEIFNGTTQAFIELIPTIIENLGVELTQNILPFLEDDKGTCANNIFVEDVDELGLILGSTFGGLMIITGVFGVLTTCGAFDKRKPEYEKRILDF